MSKTNALENAWLLLLFNNTNIANVGDATGLRGSSTAGSLYVSLHSADPGEAGAQNTSEANYLGYARVAVARSSAGWTVSGNTVVPAADITFPAGTGSPGTVTHAGVGTDSSGAGTLLYKGALSPNIATGSGITPKVTAAGTSITED